MRELIKKIHMYLGLLNFSILLVFGVAGLLATMEPEPAKRHRPEPQVEYRDFKVAPGMTDRQVADAVFAQVKPPLASPLPNYALRHDEDNNLSLDFYSPNGQRRVVVLEKENRVRVEVRRNGFARYLNALHTTTINRLAPDIRVRLWTYYNEFSIWSLIAMAVSGVYLWLASRPRYSAAWIAFGAGSGGFIALWVLTR